MSADGKLLVGRIQAVAADCAEFLSRGDGANLPPKNRRAAIRLLQQIAHAEPKHIHRLFCIPTPDGERAARQSGHLQRLAYLLHEFGGTTIEQVAEELNVERGAAQRLIEAGHDQHVRAMREHWRRESLREPGI